MRMRDELWVVVGLPKKVELFTQKTSPPTTLLTPLQSPDTQPHFSPHLHTTYPSSIPTQPRFLLQPSTPIQQQRSRNHLIHTMSQFTDAFIPNAAPSPTLLHYVTSFKLNIPTITAHDHANMTETLTYEWPLLLHLFTAHLHRLDLV